MVVRNNNDAVFRLPRRTIEELCHMVVSFVVLLVVWDIAALVCIGFVVGTHLHAHPDEPLLLPNESELLFNLLEQHHLLSAANGSNCTDSTGSTCITTPMSWAYFWAAVPIVLDDATATQVVWQRTMHHLCKADWWRLTMGFLAAVIVVRTFFGYSTLFWPRHHHDDDSNDHPTKHLRELVAAALQRLATREGHGGGKGASPTTASADVCGICLDGLLIQKNNMVVEGCRCRHAFHDHCIADWLCRGGYQCPLCRQDFLDAATTRKLRRCHNRATSTTSHYHHGYFFS
jgi:hypothetical protein